MGKLTTRDNPKEVQQEDIQDKLRLVLSPVVSNSSASYSDTD